MGGIGHGHRNGLGERPCSDDKRTRTGLEGGNGVGAITVVDNLKRLRSARVIQSKIGLVDLTRKGSSKRNLRGALFALLEAEDALVDRKVRCGIRDGHRAILRIGAVFSRNGDGCGALGDSRHLSGLIDCSDTFVAGLPDNRLVSLRGNDRRLKLLGCSAHKHDLLLIERDARSRLNNRHLARGAMLSVLSGDGNRSNTCLDRGHDAVCNRGDRRIARRPGQVLVRCIIGLNRCGQRRGLTAHSKLKV